MRKTYERFDLVSIITTRNVKYLNDVFGKMPDPNGVWTVVCTFPKNGDLLIQKERAVVRIPASNIRRIGSYDPQRVFDNLEKLNERFRIHKKNS